MRLFGILGGLALIAVAVAATAMAMSDSDKKTAAPMHVAYTVAAAIAKQKNL